MIMTESGVLHTRRIRAPGLPEARIRSSWTFWIGLGRSSYQCQSWMFQVGPASVGLLLCSMPLIALL